MTRVGPYVWGADPTYETNALDPYSHWMLTFGRDFDFAANQLKEDLKDFSYVTAIHEPDYDYLIKSNQLVLRLLKEGRDLSPKPNDSADTSIEDIENNENNENNEDDPLHLLRVPLRRRSLPPDVPDFVKHDSLASVRQLIQQRSEERAGNENIGDEEWTMPENLDPNQTVVIAVIDDAMNIGHHRFRDEDGHSRVDFAWIQDGVAVPESRIPFGREWTREQIDEKIGDNGNDHQGLLVDLGLVDFTRPGFNPLAQRASHGTHVLDLAAGSDPGEPGAANRRIIAVSLPSLVTFETSGALLGAFFLWGLQYILDRTRKIASRLRTPRVPLVVNFSYGLAGGPHDGTHFVESAIEALLDNHSGRSDGRVPVQIVLPSGNANLGRGHASKSAEANDETVELNLPWRLQPGDTTSSYLEIWLPPDAVEVKLSVGWPGAGSSALPNLAGDNPHKLWRVGAGEMQDKDGKMQDKTVIARVTHEPAKPPGKQRVVIAVAPTEVLRADRDRAPSGVWPVTVSARLPSRGSIEAWIQRDDSPIGSRLQGRQSYFDDPAYVRFDAKGDVEPCDPVDGDSVVRRSGALNGIATEKTPVVVGGYVNGDAGRPPAPYSGTAGPKMDNPTVAAASERSRVHLGILAAGSRSGSRVAINGTSVAVPQVTRRLAKAMQSGELDGGVLSKEQITGILQEEDMPADRRSEQPEPERIGVGRLDFRPLTGNIPDR